MEFGLNDVVSWAGVSGTVTEDYGNAIKAQFEGGKSALFSKCGRLHTWHKDPSLVLVQKAQKKVEVRAVVHLFQTPAGGIIVSGTPKGLYPDWVLLCSVELSGDVSVGEKVGMGSYKFDL